LTSKMLVLTDETQILCIYPYRDSESTKITDKTKNAVIVGYGALGIGDDQLNQAVETTFEYIKQVSGGEIGMIKVFNCLRK